MRLSGLQQHLTSSFDPAWATLLDAVIELSAADETLRFRIRDGILDFEVDPGTTADATFLFADAETAWALLTGRADAFEAFMEGRFRSNGYLMWAFRLMAIFRSTSLPVAPTE
jgi:putative sterol carrier protein